MVRKTNKDLNTLRIYTKLKNNIDWIYNDCFNTTTNWLNELYIEFNSYLKQNRSNLSTALILNRRKILIEIQINTIVSINDVNYIILLDWDK